MSTDVARRANPTISNDVDACSDAPCFFSSACVSFAGGQYACMAASISGADPIDNSTQLFHPLDRVASKSPSLQVSRSFIVCSEHNLIPLLSEFVCGCLVGVIVGTMALRQRRRSKSEASKSTSKGAIDVSTLLRMFALTSCFADVTCLTRTATNAQTAMSLEPSDLANSDTWRETADVI